MRREGKGGERGGTGRGPQFKKPTPVIRWLVTGLMNLIASGLVSILDWFWQQQGTEGADRETPKALRR